jgi:hypothetical protein
MADKSRSIDGDQFRLKGKGEEMVEGNLLSLRKRRRLTLLLRNTRE